MLSKTFVLCAALVASAVAQTSRLAFTTLPGSIQAGKSTTLRWAGGDSDEPVTITLKRGTSDNLQTVGFVVQNAQGNSYQWTVDPSTPSGNDYALQITQDGDQINYTGIFSISGGSSGSSSASSASATSAAASSSASSSSNATTTITARPSGTGIVGTAGTGVGSAGTGISQSRNTTLSRATLSASSSSASATTSSEEASSTEGMGSPTESESPAPSPSSGVGSLSSNVGLLLAGIAAVAYLG